VEAVAAGEVRQDVAGAELVQAHRALRLLRRGPPRPAPPHQAPHHAFLRVHLPLHAGHRRALAAFVRDGAGGGGGTAASAPVRSAQLYAPRAVMPAAKDEMRSLGICICLLFRLPRNGTNDDDVPCGWQVYLLMAASLLLRSFWSSRSLASRALLSSVHPWIISITPLRCCCRKPNLPILNSETNHPPPPPSYAYRDS